MGRAAPKTRSDEQAVPVAKHQDPKAAALLIGVEPALGPDTLLRMSRLFQMLLEALDPYPLVHQLRNRLSGVLLNIEFVEMMLTEAPELGEERIGREQHTQILTAIGHARRASGDIVEILRGAGDASAR